MRARRPTRLYTHCGTERTGAVIIYIVTVCYCVSIILCLVLAVVVTIITVVVIIAVVRYIIKPRASTSVGYALRLIRRYVYISYYKTKKQKQNKKKKLVKNLFRTRYCRNNLRPVNAS